MGPVAAQLSSGDSADAFLWLLAFGFAVLVIFTLIYMYLKGVNVTFGRLYGLMVIAVIAAALAFADIADEARTAAFTLLGTIAGYLAGARPARAEPATREEEGGSAEARDSVYL